MRGIDAKRGEPRTGDTSSTVEAEGFDGHLRCASLADLIQLECSTRARNAVSVHSEGREGHLFFDAGQIVHATATNGLEGEAAAFEMLGWTTGTFGRSSAAWPDAPSVTLTWQQLLLSAAQQRDEQHRESPGVSMSRLKAVRGSAPPAPLQERSATPDPWLAPSLRPGALAPPTSRERLEPRLASDDQPRTSRRSRPTRHARRLAIGVLSLALLALGAGWGISHWMAQRGRATVSGSEDMRRAPTPNAPVAERPATPPAPSGGVASPLALEAKAPSASSASPATPSAPVAAATATEAASPSREAGTRRATPPSSAGEPASRKPPVTVRRVPAPTAPNRASPPPAPAKPPEGAAPRAWDNDSPFPP